MFKHFLLGVLRQFARQKAYSLITVFGLAIGLACFLTTAGWLRFETSFDSSWSNGDRIARVIGTQPFATGDFQLAALPFKLAPALAEEFPGIEQIARVQSPSSLLLAHGEKRFYENSVFYADSNILEIFELPLSAGEKSTALLGQDRAVLSSEVAEKYFGREDPIGQTIRLDNRVDLLITGVFEPVPLNVCFRPGVLVTMNTHAAVAAGTYLHDWRTNAYNTFVLLRAGIDRDGLVARMKDILTRFRPDGTPPRLSLEPLRELHLTPNLQGDYGQTRSKTLLWMFGATALLVLFIACVNYTNLATARAVSRDREIGVRKVLGADRRKLLAQFFGESFIVTGFAMLLALVFSELIAIGASRWYGAQWGHYSGFDFTSFGIILCVWLVTAFGAGIYPAISLSALPPVLMLRPLATGTSRATIFRGALVVLQFVVSIALIIGTITIYRQLSFFASHDAGFNREQIVTVPLAGQELREQVPALKAALASHPAVRSVTAMGALPSANQQSSASFNWEGGPPDQQLLFNLNVIDENYLETFGLTLVAGRNFRPDEPQSETSTPCLINETAAAKMGWSDPVGRNIIQPPELKINVIGVVKDYNYASLHLPIRPLMLYTDPARPTNLAIKISTDNYSKTLSELEALWSRVVPARPFNYAFLDASFAAAYQAEQQAGKILLMFTALAITLACLGLISLASYRIARRTKETGIRKVLGASVSSLFVLHAREFVIWIVIANIVAWPIAYVAMQKWLENFAYRVDIAWWSMVVAGLGALALSLLTIALQTLKAATNNPVRSLRYE